jgi:hypothetical protein
MMKFLKLTDLFTQAVLMLTCLVIVFTTGEAETAFILFYFVLGGWQLLSYLIHFLFYEESWYHKKTRNLYGKTLLCTVAGLIASLFLSATREPFLLYFLYALLFITPLYAIGYFIIVYRELQTIQRKAFIHLKN